MELSFVMVCLERALQLLEEFAQSFCGYVVVEISTDCQIWALLALILAESASQSNGSIQPKALYMFVYDGEILRVSARETGTPEANHNLHGAVILEHFYPSTHSNAQNAKT